MLTPCQNLLTVTVRASRSGRQRLSQLRRRSQNLALYGSWRRCNVKHLHKALRAIEPNSQAMSDSVKVVAFHMLAAIRRVLPIERRAGLQPARHCLFFSRRHRSRTWPNALAGADLRAGDQVLNEPRPLPLNGQTPNGGNADNQSGGLSGPLAASSAIRN